MRALLKFLSRERRPCTPVRLGSSPGPGSQQLSDGISGTYPSPGHQRQLRIWTGLIAEVLSDPDFRKRERHFGGLVKERKKSNTSSILSVRGKPSETQKRHTLSIPAIELCTVFQLLGCIWTSKSRGDLLESGASRAFPGPSCHRASRWWWAVIRKRGGCGVPGVPARVWLPTQL